MMILMQSLVLLFFTFATVAAFEEFADARAVPEGAALVFAWPTHSLLHQLSTAARLASPFAVLVHRSARLVLTGASHEAKPVWSAKAHARALGLAVLDCGTGGIVEPSDACATVVHADRVGTAAEACAAAIFADQIAASLRCVAEVPRPAVVVYDSWSMFAASVALRLGVPGVLVHSAGSFSDRLVAQLASNALLQALCAEAEAAVCAPTSANAAVELAHTRGHLVLDWFDGAAPLDDGRGVLRILPLAGDDHEYQAPLDVSGSSTVADVSRFLALEAPFVLVSFGEHVRLSAALFASVLQQLMDFCRDGAACRVLWPHLPRSELPDWLLATPGAVAHLGVLESPHLLAVVSGGDAGDLAGAVVHSVPLVVLPLGVEPRSSAKRGVAVAVESADELAAALVTATSESGRARVAAFHSQWSAVDSDRVFARQIAARLAPPPPPPPPIHSELHKLAEETQQRVLAEFKSWREELKVKDEQQALHSEL